MSVSIFLQVILGLAVVYLLMCMFTSGTQELVSRLLNQRGKYLRENLQSLLPDRWIYLRVINHPVVSGLYRDVPARGVPPSYIPSRNFAQALIDVLVCRHQSVGSAPAYDIDAARAAVYDARNKDLAAGHALTPILARAKTMEEALSGVEKWFESSTARLSGWYKARAQKLLFLIGLGVAVVLNVDTIQITQALSASESVRTAVSQAAEWHVQATSGADAEAVRNELNQLAQAGLPVGYACLGSQQRSATTGTNAGSPDLATIINRCRGNFEKIGTGEWVLKIMGWLLTALATALGAPFWFDLVNRFVNLRSSGNRPAPAT
ncbi:MAG TPA: hypothetical protein DIC36_01040 [Gammaproteobacteria bacterium]|nr:hypothetical protein [Gammaproteobacteria bacterium]